MKPDKSWEIKFPPKDYGWYVFIKNYFPGDHAFGIWEPENEAYGLTDGDVYTGEQIKDNFENDCFFFNDDELEKILFKHFKNKRQPAS